jgi:hypothetical protein
MSVNYSKVISPKAMEICRKLGELAPMKEFCLAGGTGLALQLIHRRSDDLDFFLFDMHRPLTETSILDALEHTFPNQPFMINLQESTQLDLTIMETKLTYFSYPFKLINPLIEGGTLAPFLVGIKLAAPQEISLMKAYSIGRRATFRDYIDLYFLFKTNAVDLAYIEANAKHKFVLDDGETLFSMKQFLEQLTFSADIQDKHESINMILGKQIAVEDISDYLNNIAKEYLQNKFSR